jgi:hypothetical protein
LEQIIVWKTMFFRLKQIICERIINEISADINMDKKVEFPAENKVNNFVIYHQNIRGLYNK